MSSLDGLNPEQRRAVEVTRGPLLVLAGAGTGKTRVVTVRIGRLIESGVRPSNILAVTFTNKAAGELRERLGKVVGKNAAKHIHAGTFHSLCARMLREYGEAIGIPTNYAICDASDQLTTAKKALRQCRIPEAKLHPRDFLSKISLAKNRSISCEQYLSKAADDREELIGRAWRRYEDQLQRTRSLDFDDLLLRTGDLLAQHEPTLKKLRKEYGHITVDEFQDTNEPQYRIVSLLSQEHRNLCVVGDDDQSIYGWRGADVQKILNFDKEFPEAVVVRLETNYRSTPQILKTANTLISNNTGRHDKVLRSAAVDGPPVTALSLRDETEEADHVAKEVQKLARDHEIRLEDFAVLFRTAIQARAFELQFRARAIPYVLIGGQSFFDRKEVRDVLAYLRLIYNHDDEVSFLRVVNCPPRGIGKSSIERIITHATNEGISVPRALKDIEKIEGLTAAARESLLSFRNLLKTLSEHKPGKDLPDFIRRAIEAVSYKQEVERTYDDPKLREERWSGVEAVLDTAENHASRRKKPSLGTFLQELTLSAEGDRDSNDNRKGVTFMTMHAAKGLEFPRIYLPGIEEGLVPHMRSIADDHIEEERRLLYVGITRARYSLTLTYSMERSKHGHRVECMPSRFLFELMGKEPPSNWRAAKPTEEDLNPAARKKKKGKKRARRGTGVR